MVRTLDMLLDTPASLLAGTHPQDRVRDTTRPIPHHPRALSSPRWVPATPPPSSEPPAALSFEHPLVLVDAGPGSLAVIRSLARRGMPLTVLGGHRLEPALHARPARARRLPPLPRAPERWLATLLELAARLEPRPMLLPGTKRALAWIHRLRATLAPHYEMTRLQLLPEQAPQDDADATLRRTVLRGEPAFEVQLVCCPAGDVRSHLVLAWTAGAVPYVVVTSIAGQALVQRSRRWLQDHGWGAGYARLVWGPDRHGRIALQTVNPVPGTTWNLGEAEGLDLPSQWVACLAGIELAPEEPARRLSKRLALVEPGVSDPTLPLVRVAPRFEWRDPLPWCVQWFRDVRPH